MMKYPREAIVAAIELLTADEFRPIYQAIEEDGVHPWIAEAARQAACDLAIDILSMEDVTSDFDLLSKASEVGMLHGVRIGLKLAENERRVTDALDTMRLDGSLKVKHYVTPDDATADGLKFYYFEKVGGTSMARVDGHFSCETIDGNVAHCDDGWLAIDTEGRLYPVADSVARVSYNAHAL